MKIDLDAFFGPTADRSIEDLADEQRNGVVAISAWKFAGAFPNFSFLQYGGLVTHINIILHPERPALLDFSSIPMPDAVVHVSISGGNIRRHGGWKYSQDVGVIRGLSYLHNLKNLELKDFPALTFGDDPVSASLQRLAIFNPGKLNVRSVPETSARHVELNGFDRRLVQDYSFISRFFGMEILWMNYCNGLEVLPALHPQAPVKEVCISKARRLKDIAAMAEKKEIGVIAFRFCPLLTAEDFRCLQALPKLKQFYVSDKKQEAAMRALFPQAEIILERLT